MSGVARHGVTRCKQERYVLDTFSRAWIDDVRQMGIPTLDGSFVVNGKEADDRTMLKRLDLQYQVLCWTVSLIASRGSQDGSANTVIRSKMQLWYYIGSDYIWARYIDIRVKPYVNGRSGDVTIRVRGRILDRHTNPEEFTLFVWNSLLAWFLAILIIDTCLQGTREVQRMHLSVWAYCILGTIAN